MRVPIAASITPDGTITVRSLSRRPASSSPTATASSQGPYGHPPSRERHAPDLVWHSIHGSQALTLAKAGDPAPLG
jgi:hypothetical protein